VSSICIHLNFKTAERTMNAYVPVNIVAEMFDLNDLNDDTFYDHQAALCDGTHLQSIKLVDGRLTAFER
jgi:hypothetical protein